MLATDEKTYPVWSCQFYVNETDGPLEFKFVKFSNRPDGKVDAEWEEIAENRKIEILNRVSVVVEAAFGESGTRKETFVQRRVAPSVPLKHKEMVKAFTQPLPEQY